MAVASLREFASHLGGAQDDGRGSDSRDVPFGYVPFTVARPCRIPTGFRQTIVDIASTVPRAGCLAKTAHLVRRREDAPALTRRGRIQQFLGGPGRHVMTRVPWGSAAR
ncbi:hypothetical protein SVIO_022120 [Streptomyces violaceusniger]|uniref:Uncharacterized protein n=1 Tax=Streptomyces violaceusniger TaxID=68280 RepID=A0A4D4L0M2_STRVO|nr:hypothetical protein SVIO_022120 [Streptomyces violaceusniger]